MPLFGVRDVGPLLDGVAVMPDLATEPLTLPGADVLQAMFEIDDAVMLELLPKALHPTIPPTVTFVLWRCPESPVGPFNLAQVRIGCRAGVRPRGFLAASRCDSQAAADLLRARWGFDCRPGVVRLRRYHDRVVGSVVVNDETVLQVGLVDPTPISGGDLQYAANMNLARVRRESGERPLLVQVDPEYTFQRADRGRATLDVFVPGAWQAEGVRPVYPVAASHSRCDLTLPAIRFVTDPERPALQATEHVGG